MTKYTMKAKTLRSIVEYVHDEDYIIIEADENSYNNEINLTIKLEYLDKKEEKEKIDTLAEMYDCEVYRPMFPKQYYHRVNSVDESITKEYLLKEYNITEEQLKDIEKLAFEERLGLRRIIARVVNDKMLNRSLQLRDELKSYLEEYVLPPYKHPVRF